jgi:hypothetical protein
VASPLGSMCSRSFGAIFSGGSLMQPQRGWRHVGKCWPLKHHHPLASIVTRLGMTSMAKAIRLLWRRDVAVTGSWGQCPRAPIAMVDFWGECESTSWSTTTRRQQPLHVRACWRESQTRYTVCLQAETEERDSLLRRMQASKDRANTGVLSSP